MPAVEVKTANKNLNLIKRLLTVAIIGFLPICKQPEVSSVC